MWPFGATKRFFISVLMLVWSASVFLREVTGRLA
jgi:hypothetical protein